jgi:HK97 family phage portal protein
MGLAQTLARLITPRQKANPAGEGNYHPGPYTVSGGWLPHSWGQNLNFWQMDLDPLPFPTSSIVEACVWAYVRAIAQLPGYHRRELDNGGTETVTTSALSRLLRVPNGYQTPSDFLVHLIRSLLLNGNSYWVAQRNERSEVVALHWTDPRGCCVREIGVQGQVFKEVFYEISSNPLVTFPNSIGANNIVVPARDVFHVKLATPRHPLVGETWLAALALELFQRGAINNASSTFAQNMSRPSGVLSTDLTLTKAQVDELRERWNAQAAGLNAGGVPILTSGLKFNPISVSNQDAQIIEQLKLNDRTVAAVMGVPAILLGISDTATQKSAEAIMSEWLASGLGWLINHIEVALDAFIGLNGVAAGKEWTEYDTKALLRSLFKEQIDGLARSVQAGIHAPDDARLELGFSVVPGGHGKIPRVQQQMVPLDFVPPEPKPAPVTTPQPAANDDKPEAELDEADKRALIMGRIKRDMHERRIT